MKSQTPLSQLTQRDYLKELEFSRATLQNLQAELHTFEQDPETFQPYLNIINLVENFPNNLWDLPEFLKSNKTELDSLRNSLWFLFEEHGIDLDLGDDGTDEAEQSLEALYYYTTLFTPGAYCQNWAELDEETLDYLLLLFYSKNIGLSEIIQDGTPNIIPFDKDDLQIILDTIERDIQRTEYHKNYVTLQIIPWYINFERLD